MKGVLFIHGEQGSAGDWLAFQDAAHIAKTGKPAPHDEQWSYEGLYPLEKGDQLTVFSKGKRRRILWTGVFRGYRGFNSPSCSVCGFIRNHWHPRGANPKYAIRWFHGKYPAELTKARPRK